MLCAMGSSIMTVCPGAKVEVEEEEEEEHDQLLPPDDEGLCDRAWDYSPWYPRNRKSCWVRS